MTSPFTRCGLPVLTVLFALVPVARLVCVADSRRIEIRPILQRQIGQFQLIFNPVFARALHGPGTREGWEFEPAARVALGDSDTNRVMPYLEWYSELGSLPALAPAAA